MKMIRNNILGQFQDGVDAELSLQVLNSISGTFTAHLRPKKMQFEFQDETATDAPVEAEEELEEELDELVEEEPEETPEDEA
jgi:hypothetical protein